MKKPYLSQKFNITLIGVIITLFKEKIKEKRRCTQTAHLPLVINKNSDILDNGCGFCSYSLPDFYKGD